MAIIDTNPYCYAYITNGGWNTNPTSRSIAGQTYFTGASFIAPISGTVTKIYFCTNTVTTPVFELEGAITTIDDSTGFSGTDIGVSTNSVTNPAATTNYTLTVSASVTAGTCYGVIIRVKSGTYTSGSALVRSLFGGSGMFGASNPNYRTLNLYDVGAGASKGQGFTTIQIEIDNNIVYVPGLTPIQASGILSTNITSSGLYYGNKLRIYNDTMLWGYIFAGETDGDQECRVYSTNYEYLPVYTCTRNSAFRGNFTSTAIDIFNLSTPAYLPAGEYIFGRYMTTNAGSNSLFGLSLPKMEWTEFIAPGLYYPNMAAYYKNSSDVWTPYTDRIYSIFPLLSGFRDGAVNIEPTIGI